MITRAQYMANSKLHHSYYIQFATKRTYAIVTLGIGLKRIMDSEDISFNDIPLRNWDLLNESIRESIDTKLKGAAEGFPVGKYGWSLSDCVCIAKAVAREIKERESK